MNQNEPIVKCNFEMYHYFVKIQSPTGLMKTTTGHMPTVTFFENLEKNKVLAKSSAMSVENYQPILKLASLATHRQGHLKIINK